MMGCMGWSRCGDTAMILSCGWSVLNVARCWCRTGKLDVWKPPFLWNLSFWNTLVKGYVFLGNPPFNRRFSPQKCHFSKWLSCRLQYPPSYFFYVVFFFSSLASFLEELQMGSVKLESWEQIYPLQVMDDLQRSKANSFPWVLKKDPWLLPLELTTILSKCMAIGMEKERSRRRSSTQPKPQSF